MGTCFNCSAAAWIHLALSWFLFSQILVHAGYIHDLLTFPNLKHAWRLFECPPHHSQLYFIKLPIVKNAKLGKDLLCNVFITQNLTYLDMSEDNVSSLTYTAMDSSGNISCFGKFSPVNPQTTSLAIPPQTQFI